MRKMKELPVLSPEEVRVLGCLMEKSRTTPDYYPMTLNSITAACNQRSSRQPVTDYTEEQVQSALNSLKASDLAATAVGGGSRVVKYKHNLRTLYDISDAQFAALCLLFLRGPLTPGEINSASGRLYEFSSIDSVTETLHQLTQMEHPMVMVLPRQPGQRDARYAHLFSGAVAVTSWQEPEEIKKSPSNDTASRLEALEQQVAEMKAALDRITKELFG
jgi:uncharacterized protein